MSRHQISSEANNLKELLNSSIDPSNESFWGNLRHCVLTSNEITTLNRRSIMNLKLIFTEIPNNLHSISSITHLLKLLKPSLKSDIGGEIGATINTILFDSNDAISSNDISAFLSSSGYICSGNFKLKRAILDEVIEQFSENLAQNKLANCSPIVLSSLFELMITLISQCPENRTLLSQYLDEIHISKCINIIENCDDSLAQMLITEWLWRSINSLPSKPNIRKIFGSLSNSFEKISMVNFRESLHFFVMAINQKSNSIIHIEFNRIQYNNVNLGIKGWIDLNSNSIALWLTNQSSLEGSGQNLPDVVVLRIPMLYNCKITQKQIIFYTKEKLQTFNSFSREKPCKFEFSLCKKIDKQTTEAFMNRLQANKKDEINGKTGISNTKCKKGKEIENRIQEKSSKKFLNTDKKRIYAKSNSRNMNFESEDEEIKFEKKHALDSEFTNDDFIFGKTTQEKDNNLEKIEAMLNDFQKSSIDSINQMETSAQLEINNIVSKLEDNMHMLNQLAQQHKDLTEITTNESQAIGENVSNLENEFKVKNDDMIQKRNSICIQVNDEIESEKLKFVHETDIAFENNAIVGLTTHLSNLREIMCDIPV